MTTFLETALAVGVPSAVIAFGVCLYRKARRGTDIDALGQKVERFMPIDWDEINQAIAKAAHDALVRELLGRDYRINTVGFGRTRNWPGYASDEEEESAMTVDALMRSYEDYGIQYPDGQMKRPSELSPEEFATLHADVEHLVADFATRSAAAVSRRSAECESGPRNFSGPSASVPPRAPAPDGSESSREAS